MYSHTKQPAGFILSPENSFSCSKRQDEASERHLKKI